MRDTGIFGLREFSAYVNFWPTEFSAYRIFGLHEFSAYANFRPIYYINEFSAYVNFRPTPTKPNPANQT